MDPLEAFRENLRAAQSPTFTASLVVKSGVKTRVTVEVWLTPIIGETKIAYSSLEVLPAVLVGTLEMDVNMLYWLAYHVCFDYIRANNLMGLTMQAADLVREVVKRYSDVE